MRTPGRVSLCQLPTPLHRLDRASDELGIDLWIKRDDLTGFAGGGNKGRKLEFLMASFLARGVQTVVCSGSTQSNFVRQLGAACAVFGLRCVAVVMDTPYPDGQTKPLGGLPSSGGNAVLDGLFGVDVRKVDDGTWSELENHTILITDQLASVSDGVETVPLGGGTPEAVYAFQLAAQEIPVGFAHVITASSSGSTHVGLAMGFAGTGTRVTGVACDAEPEMRTDLADLSRAAADSGYGTALAEGAIDFRLDWVGPGYGVPSDEGRAAQEWLACKEGVVLDPIYTAKAFAGLHAMARSGELTGKTLFWHTGGLPVACLADQPTKC